MRLISALFALMILSACSGDPHPHLPDGAVKEAPPKPFTGKVTVGLGADAPSYPKSHLQR